MANMSASGWTATGAIEILQSQRPWGPNSLRRVLVKMNFYASYWATGAGLSLYPSNGIPAPQPSLVGLREYISYIIPLSPFFGGNPTTFAQKAYSWGCVPPTEGASGAATNSDVPRLRFIGGVPLATAAGGAAASFTVPAFTMEFTTDVAATAINAVNGGALTAFALFVGK